MVIEADDKKAMELALIENLQRADLNPIEEALGYQELMGTYEMTQEQAAARGVHMLWVSQDLMDARTISKRDMRRQVNLYMQTVMGEQPIRPDLLDFDDALTW